MKINWAVLWRILLMILLAVWGLAGLIRLSFDAITVAEYILAIATAVCLLVALTRAAE